jgi:hypothetical protein
MACHAAVLYGALASKRAALCFGLPPWVTQKAEPCARGSLHRNASQVLFFGNVGNLFSLLRVFPRLLS